MKYILKKLQTIKPHFTLGLCAGIGAAVMFPLVAKTVQANSSASEVVDVEAPELISADVAGVEMRPYLTLATAEKAANACHQLAVANGWQMAIAIKDTGGNLVHFSKMDNAFAKASEVALLKAETSSTTPYSTMDMRGVVFAENGVTHGIEHVPGIAIFDGGLPINAAGSQQVGGIGVSGNTAENDGICAQAAIEAIAADLQ